MDSFIYHGLQEYLHLYTGSSVARLINGALSSRSLAKEMCPHVTNPAKPLTKPQGVC